MKKILICLFVLTVVVSAQENILQLKAAMQNNIVLEEGNDVSFDLPQKKSRGLAILYSMLLPGMGELYGGDYSTGKYLTIADGLLWGTVIGLNTYGNWEKNNYEEHARAYAGVSPEGKDHEFFSAVGDYNSQEEYNEIMNLNREYSEVYAGDEYYWNWENDTRRREFRQSWTDSESAYNNVRFAVGGLIINRIISAINAVRVVNRYNKNLPVSGGVKMGFKVGREPDNSSKLILNFGTSF